MKKLIKSIISKIWGIFPLSNTIVFESLNDLDCNSGAVFNYMIENNLNKKYKIIWLVQDKNKVKNIKIKNVTFYKLYNYTIWQKIRIGNAKFILYDNKPIKKYRKDQTIIYLTHGFPGIKNTKAFYNTDEYADYILCTSKKMIQQSKELFSTTDKKIFICGLPRNDDLYKNSEELSKIINKEEFKKIIIWMPTFRKFYKDNRNDSNKEFKLGIPLIDSEEQLKKLNSKLKKLSTMLIIKIHPGQDLSVLKLKNFSNIKILLPNDIKEKNINLYKLMNETDALITDYSSVYFDYLLLDKPIAFVLDDIKEFKIKFLYDNVLDWMAGDKIYDYDGLEIFIENLFTGQDDFKEQRKKIRDISNEYQDGKNCERVIKFIMSLEEKNEKV